ncbi:hypothetical protein LEMLEM_LOCUS8015, partial [Lemmus lemmus]
ANQSVLPRRARDVRSGAESSCNFWRVPVRTGKRTAFWPRFFTTHLLGHPLICRHTCSSQLFS